MNAGVSSRGSPTPKSITGTPRASRSRLASVSRTKGYVRRPVRTGDGFTPAPRPRSARARGSRARARRPRSTRSRVCACGGSPGPKFTAAMPAAPNSATGVQACLGSMARSPAAISASTSGPGRDRARRRVAVDPQLAVAAAQLDQARLRLLRRAPGRVAVVDGRLGQVRDDVARDPARDLRDRHDLGEAQAVEVVRLGLVGGERGDPGGGAVDRVVGEPRARRVARDAVEAPGRVDVAEAARVDRVVGRLHHHHELGGERVAREQRRQRALGERQLLAAEEQRAERRAVAHELDHHRERALHVAGAEAERRARRRGGRAGCPGPGRCRDDRRAPRARPPGRRARRCRRGRAHPAAGRARAPQAAPRHETPKRCRSARASWPPGARPARARSRA